MFGRWRRKEKHRASKQQGDPAALEREGDRVANHLESARQDWKAKKADPQVPGAQPDDPGGEQGDSRPSERQANPPQDSG